MTSYLAYLNFINFPVCKSYTVNERAHSFDELDDDEFRKRFRLTKATALLLLSEVNCQCQSTINYNT